MANNWASSAGCMRFPALPKTPYSWRSSWIGGYRNSYCVRHT